MVKLSKSQLRRLKKALRRESNPRMRQRIQMVVLRETGMTQPEIAEVVGVSLSTVNRAHMAFDGGRAGRLVRLGLGSRPSSFASTFIFTAPCVPKTAPVSF
jgi:hypothetical protein